MLLINCKCRLTTNLLRKQISYFRKCSTISSNPKCIISRNDSTFPAAKQKFNLIKDGPITYGQPTAITHPHILNIGEVVQNISVEELKTRRNKLMESIQKYALNLDKKLRNHIVVIPSASKKYMSDKIPYVFRQSSDFLYLSGCLEADSTLIMSINEREEIKTILFMRPKDKHAELWDGDRTGFEQAPELFGVDESFSVNDLSKYISHYMKHHSSFCFWYDSKVTERTDVTNVINQCLSAAIPNTTESPTIFVHKLRLIKSKAEIDLMRKTCNIASNSINKTISESKIGDSEHHLYARVDYHSRMNGASFLAYPPVVASGKNATTIHYINNSQIIKNGDLVLMDAGCEYGGYTSDITRTWPINGKFTESQKVIYEMLLTVQQELIDNLLQTGGVTLDQLFDTMCSKLGQYLKEIGLIPKQLTSTELTRAAYNFCPHHVSHYLGMDVHDTPLISRSINLSPGIVCTVEPGIYISANRKDVPEEFRGIGLRIEDDVLITSDSSVEVLTENCVKDLKKLERLITNT